ncbi:uncharacterized mitochondrial protein AtMg00820-like [Gossypium raimondii]|uniref:Uncharacterized mitochondrial protein AtMg00820-like n=1 Tax=Gossypium hirsutum TaxID=3635 RepID=A0A1U8M094_GOSHI|nr:uncharacterized mitochondrial protein AtMg00820-like [Gossypium hirsutum]XP_052478316.1 uncharacterized mitochondrial protein AtMg00820-like [Gossypium raimondii]
MVITDESEMYEQDEIDVDDFSVRGIQPISKIYERADMAILKPINYEEVALIEGWKEAMQAELKMIHKNQTWEFVDKSSHKRVIGVNCNRTKLNADGSLNKLKARLVMKGFSQQYEIDYMETFASIARLDTTILLLALAA